MDHPQVTEERSGVPAWAKQESSPGTAQQQADEALSGKPPMSDPQLRYIKDLLEKKQIPPKDEGNVDLIYKCCRLREQGEYGMSKDYATKIIDWLKSLSDKPREERSAGYDNPERLAMGVPAGRYAVEADNGELRFYKVWVSRDGKRLNVYVQHGPDESALRYQKGVIGVLRKIKEYGIRKAAIRYGMEIGECSNCGRRLTNRISRELGIGPICGGRMFGEDGWKDEVKTARAEIKARGEDPDEELD